MKLIDNWQKVYKSFSVVLPFLATTVALLISLLTNLQTSGVIDVNSSIFWGYALTILTGIGRVIPQVGLFFPTEDTEETK